MQDLRGVLPRVKAFFYFGVVFFLTRLLWTLKLQCPGFAKLLEPSLSQKGQRGESVGERSQFRKGWHQEGVYAGSTPSTWWHCVVTAEGTWECSGSVLRVTPGNG